MEETFSSFCYNLLVASAILLITTTGYLYQQGLQKSTKLPPGPSKIPVLGNLLQVIKSPILTTSKWANTYGNFYTIYLGSTPALVINDVKTMKEIFKETESTGKFVTDTTFLLTRGEYGMANTVGNKWQEQRRFCMKSLKEFGFGNKTIFEPLLCREAQNLCDYLKTKSGQSLVLDDVLYKAAINSLWLIVTGEKFDFSDLQVQNLMRTFIGKSQYTIRSGLGLFPKLKYIAPGLSGYTDLKNASDDVHDYIDEKIKEHEKTFIKGQPRDLIDMYIEQLKKINGENKVGSSFYGEEGRANTLASIVELFIAGGRTISGTINWLLIYLAHKPEIQKKLQDEIDKVIGRDRGPSSSDSKMMPYTESVILETFRIAPVAAINITHKLLADLKFRDYDLPKDMLLFANIYHAHHNPAIWKDAESFKPERFLKENGGEKLKEVLVPFQVGKRKCPGEVSARELLFLFVVKLFQEFTVFPDPGITLEEYLTADVGVLYLPRQLGLIMIPREN